MMHLFAGSGAMIEQIGQIYALIRTHDGITRQNLASQLDLPATTLNRSLERLLTAGLIRESGLAGSSGGRRPSLYQSNYQAGLLLGVDLSSPDARLVLTDLNLQVLDSRQLPEWAELPAHDRQAALVVNCRELAGQDHLTAGMIFGLGFCLPDSTADESASDIQAAANDLGLPTCTLQPACAGLYACLWRGLPGSGNRSNGSPLIEISASDRIDLGQIRWVNPALSSLSQTRLDSMIVPSPDKSSASGIYLGQVAARPAMLNRFQRLKDDQNLTWPDFCQAAQSGKRKVSQVLREAALALAIAVMNTAVSTGSRHVLLAGDTFQDVPEYEKAFQAELIDLSTRSGTAVQILDNALGSDLRAVGAAARALEQAINVR